MRKKKDDEPEWYHYIVALGILLAIVFGIFYIVNLLNTHKAEAIFYPYKYKIGNVTYNIMFRYPHKELENNLSQAPPVKYQFLNTLKVTLSFQNYSTPEDNKLVSLAGIQLGEFLRDVLHLNILVNTTKNIDCQNATMYNYVVTFNPYSKSNKIYWENPYCLRINATNSKNIVFLSNLIMYKAVKE